jgi:hypothetical protein
MIISRIVRPAFALGAVLAGLLVGGDALADGKLVGPRSYQKRPYHGSLEERAQEGIIIFQESKVKGGAVEDLILKIRYEGDVSKFAWVIPFPTEPTTARESAELFRELHDYVETRLAQARPRSHGWPGMKSKAKSEKKPVTVLSLRTVGSYRVAVVRENQPGKLNGWLKANGYQELPDAGEVLEFYRRKGYVFACVKVDQAKRGEDKAVDLHPLRFTFKTGGRDGIYFPMKLTGLQKASFDVNLYVFYRYWLNDAINRFGYQHRGFRLRYRDWDTEDCEPDGGKAYSAPSSDPLLRGLAGRIPTVARLFRKLHPGEKYYLTNIQAHGLRPEEVRDWPDDLWLFPYMTGTPHDVRPGEPAAAGYENEDDFDPWPWLAVIGGGLAVLVVGLWVWRRRKVAGLAAAGAEGDGHGPQ